MTVELCMVRHAISRSQEDAMTPLPPSPARRRRSRRVPVAVAALLAATTILASPAAAHEPSPRVPPEAKTGNCVGALPVVVASDAAAQSDMYSAVTLAGALGTECIILAGARDKSFPAGELERLKVAASRGYVVGGKTAVSNSKISGSSLKRIAGSDRWSTARAVGEEVQRVLSSLDAATRKRNAGTGEAGTRGCGIATRSGPSSSDGRTLTASEILAKVGPSIPLVDGCLRVGSGILVDGGYVLTGYQTVGQCETADITFPDGTRHADVPIAVRVPELDYAVIGPIRTTKKALALDSGSQPSRGSRLYRIGHDFVGGDLPSIDSGRLARVDTWDRTGTKLFRTDAALGDALVDDRGQIVSVMTPGAGFWGLVLERTR